MHKVATGGIPRACVGGLPADRKAVVIREERHATMALVPVPDRVRELLAEFSEVQASPITDSALVERMRTEATRWINAVHMQHRRISEPLVNADDPGAEVWRQEIDLHFLLVSLTRLRRAIGLATRVGSLQEALIDRIVEFDGHVPYLPRLRNVGEHFDDYTVGKGRDAEVRRAQLQTWSMGSDPEGHLIWNWLGEAVHLAEAHTAATDLYRGFLADVGRYFAVAGT